MDKQTATKNLNQLITKVEGARLRISEHHIVKIIGISKYSTSTDVKTLYEAGQRAFGENKVQDLKQKMEELDELPLEWHFVGTLQKNKINNLIDLKLSCLKQEICKVGFPINALEKYTELIDEKEYSYIVYFFNQEKEEMEIIMQYEGKNNNEIKEKVN